MFRALRLDKLIYQALESTLRSLLLERYDEIPALGMIAQSLETLFTRASRFVEHLFGIPHRIVEGESVIGGGSTPQQPLPTWLIAIESEDPVEIERNLRQNDPPIIARIEDDRLLIDLRTVFPAEEEPLARAITRLCGTPESPRPDDSGC